MTAIQPGTRVVMNNSGLYWHVHHDKLFEYCYDAEGRIAYIKANKPEHEIETRLRLMKPILGLIGDAEASAASVKAAAASVKAAAAYDKAWDASDKAWDASAKAWDAYNKAAAASAKAWDAYNKAWDAYAEAWAAFYATIEPGEAEALHAIECPNCPWNGETIFPLPEEVAK